MNTQATNHQLGLWALVKRSRPINLITGPMIYSVIVPLLLFLPLALFLKLSCIRVKLNRKGAEQGMALLKTLAKALLPAGFSWNDLKPELLAG